MNKFTLFTNFFLVTLALLIGLTGGYFVIDIWLNQITLNNADEITINFWLLSRSSGIMAYILLSISILLGLFLSSKVAREFDLTKKVMELHDLSAKLGLSLVLFHAIILLGDSYLNIKIHQIIIPFTIKHSMNIWFGTGQIAFYLFAAITISYTLKLWLGIKLWHYLHPTAFFAYMLITIHGFFSGSDSQTIFMIMLYAIINGCIIFFMFYRLIELLQSK